MVFSSLLFVFLFLALNLVCYYSVKTIRQKNIVLLVFSLIFYAWGGAAYLLLLAGMAFWSWLCALMIEKNEEQKTRKLWMWAECLVLLGLLILVLMAIAGKKGLLTIVTVGINIAIFAAGFLKSGDDADVVTTCNKMVIFFAVVTLIGLNGLHRKTWAALLSTLCILAMIMGIFDVVISHTAELDYSTMEYLGSIDNPDEIFHAEILLSGLGAIMDVAVAIAAALSEIVTKRPEVTFRELFRSGREIGYDIMGTMINVLLFVFGCGLIPMCLIRMNNSVRFMTIIKLHIPCELCRFFVESIGIVLAIPVSILITAVLMKLTVRKVKKTC